MRKAQLTIKQEEVAPATTSDLVVMSHGKTLKEELSTNVLDEFSREVTVVSSMEKVADGVYDGAYESLVFKGKSLVNLVEKPTSANVGNSGKWNGYGGGNPSKTFITNGIRLANTRQGSIVLDYFDLSLFKPNTKYTLFIDVYHNGEGTAPVLDKIAGTGQYTIPLENGHNCIVFTSVPDLTVANMGIRFGCAGSTSESCVYEFSNIVIVEGDHSSINPDYFTGLCDSKMPILRNVGKNLFDVNMTNFTNVTVVPIDGSLIIKKNTRPHYYSQIPIHLKPNTEYTFKCNTYRESDTETYVKLHLGARPHNDSLEYGDYVVPVGDGAFSKTFTTNSLGELYINGYTTTKGIILSNIQLEESSTATSYEDHKTNILRTSEEIVLRSLPNGVCDTYNARTGEYVKRIGERTLNGSEAWIANSGADKQFEDVWVFHNQESLCNGTVRLCDKLQAREDANENAEFIRGGGAYIFVYISKNKVQNHNANDFKTWLQSNPMTIQYELAEPITTIVEPLTIPFAYENGHVILESGSEEQSLLPELKYSAPASKNGVISTTSKAILKHEQRLHKFEDLLLRESILMDYRLTLSFFDKM